MVESSSRQNGGKAECDQGVQAAIVRSHAETFRLMILDMRKGNRMAGACVVDAYQNSCGTKR